LCFESLCKLNFKSFVVQQFSVSVTFLKVLYYNLLLHVSTWRQASEVNKELQRMSEKGIKAVERVGGFSSIRKTFPPAVQKKLTF